MTITGVLSHNDVEPFFWEEESIDLQFVKWRERRDEFLETEEGKELLREHGYDEEQTPYPDDFDFWNDIIEKKGAEYAPPRHNNSGRELFGSWKKVDGEYEPDKSNGEYAAIYNRSRGTIQVVWSEHEVRCARASPCYPRQGDASSKPDQGYGSKRAYTLPPELLNDDHLDKMGEHILGYDPEED